MVAETLDAATEHSGDRAGVGGPMDEPTYAERDEIVRAMSLLGLDAGFSAEDLDAAYRRTAAKYHPDRSTDEAEPARRTKIMVRVNAARTLLSHYIGFRSDDVPDIERIGTRLAGFAIACAVVLQILQNLFFPAP